MLMSLNPPIFTYPNIREDIEKCDFLPEHGPTTAMRRSRIKYHLNSRYFNSDFVVCNVMENVNREHRMLKKHSRGLTFDKWQLAMEE